MTREQAAKSLPVITAYVEGKYIQYFESHTQKWIDCSEPNFHTTNTYRIKPEKKYRPWTFEEAPFPCLFRDKVMTNRFIFVKIVINGYYLPNGSFITFEQVLEAFEHSSDNGKTWLPCGTLI